MMYHPTTRAVNPLTSQLLVNFHAAANTDLDGMTGMAALGCAQRPRTGDADVAGAVAGASAPAAGATTCASRSRRGAVAAGENRLTRLRRMNPLPLLCRRC